MSGKWRKSSDNRRQEHSDENHFSASKLLRQKSAQEIRENVTVEVSTQQQSLILLAPVKMIVSFRDISNKLLCRICARHSDDDDAEVDTKHVRNETGHKQHDADIEPHRYFTWN